MHNMPGLLCARTCFYILKKPERIASRKFNRLSGLLSLNLDVTNSEFKKSRRKNKDIPEECGLAVYIISIEAMVAANSPHKKT